MKCSKKYSFHQSITRARQAGRIRSYKIAGLYFYEITPQETAGLFGISGWDGFAVVSKEQIPTGLTLLGSITKKAGVGEPFLFTLALLNQLDMYWVGGFYFANAAKAEELVKKAAFK